MHAYHAGMGTSHITLVDLAAKEDASELGRIIAVTTEDEEVFFDQMSLKGQLATL